MKKPIYLYVTTLFPAPETWEGGYCYDGVRALMRSGRYDVRVLRTGNGRDYQYNGIQVYRVPSVALPCGFAPYLLHLRKCLNFRARLQEIGIDPSEVVVCHCHTMEMAPYAVAFKKLNPQALTILHHHSISMVNVTSGRLGIVPINATLQYFYFRWLCERIDLHAFVSQASMDSYGKTWRTTPESGLVDLKKKLLFGRFFRSIRLPRGVVFYNGYDPELYRPVPNAPRDPTRFTIGCVANFFPFKDHLTLLRAIRLLKDSIPAMRVVCIGSGSTLEPCRKYIAENDLSEIVEIRPEIDHQQMPDLYRSFDLMVIPSRTEGFCCAYVESVACGVPIIGCRGISVEEMIRESERDYWLVKPFDAQGLAEKILDFYKTRRKLSFSRDFRIDVLWAEFLDFIKEVRRG